MNIPVIHYPPYRSKYNPIVYRVFALITRLWSGALQLSVKMSRQRSASFFIFANILSGQNGEVIPPSMSKLA